MKEEGGELRAFLASAAYSRSENKQQVEKSIYVSHAMFVACLSDLNPHHSNTHLKRGFLRTYHEPFFTDNPNGMGKTYHMGIVYIVDREHLPLKGLALDY